jgi:hypothetical protein
MPTVAVLGKLGAETKNPGFLRKSGVFEEKKMVRDAGFEPATPTVSR